MPSSSPFSLFSKREDQMSPKSPCRPLPDAKRAAPAAPTPGLRRAGRSRAGDRGDPRLVELEACRPERPARNLLAIIQGIVDLVDRRRVLHQRGAVLQVPAGAERAALAPQHRDGRI